VSPAPRTPVPATRRNQRSKHYFAYGSNMHVPSMRVRCPRARLIGAASLGEWEFFINAQGYASIRRVPGAIVHGAFWTIGPREESALDIYEDVAGHLYERITVDAAMPERRYGDVLTYVATNQKPGRPRAGYMRLVHESAEDLDLPEDYRETLRKWGS